MNKIFQLLALCLIGLTNSSLQAQKLEAEVRFLNGEVKTGEVKRFYVKPSFEKIDPWIIWKNMFHRDTPLHQYTKQKVSQKNLNFKAKGERKFQKIPIDSIYDVTTTSVVRTMNRGKVKEKQTYRALIANKLYNTKANKKVEVVSAFLPVLKENKTHTIYGTIYPIRSLFILYPPGVVFEGAPGAYGYLMIQNNEKNITISTETINKEKFYTAKQVEKRAKSPRNLNHSSLYLLFGDCPEAVKLIDKFYVVRMGNNKNRRQAAKDHNEAFLRSEKQFKSATSHNRSLATVELYMATYLQEIENIINTYEKNCGPVNDIYNPKHPEFKKNIDILNDEIKVL
ncbi:MAG TPA: hypothetical protein VKZ80_05440 [Flavobacterium sp.]|nr:hypothetical protein [Flavobacterium sp.]